MNAITKRNEQEFKELFDGFLRQHETRKPELECAICHEKVDKLFESPFSGDDLCGTCFDLEQEQAWGGVTPANPYKLHLVKE